ncbi:MAG TPA: asparagine synthase (glutamine-hydrolyzing) [Burkholderiaceae bacterium]|nr:asparagine synthase (glutamine-hydrolyzing) [Burkholderiaceae bacterium]
MCGIVVALSPRQPTAVATIVAMARALRHRGPDDEGYAVLADGRMLRLGGDDTPAPVMSMPTPSRPEGHARERSAHVSSLLMAHRRLSIVDLSPHGHQPMRRGEYLHGVFNGEIYNHVELRAELEALGHRFDSHSDTEVLLAAYEQWGPQAWSHFNGMWAFVIFDSQRRKLVIARDRFGVKPLYYWAGDGGELLLASEIKALLVHPRVQARVDPEACRRFVTAGAQAWHERTMFAGVHRFPAGHWAEVSIDAPAPLQPVPYWSAPEVDAVALAAPFDAATADRLAQQYRVLLDDSVRLRMRMDVRFGTALSGGLDSSQIASRVNAELRRRGMQERQEVFSSVYRGAGTGNEAFAAQLRMADESRFIAVLRERLDVRSNTVEPRWQELPAEHERMIWALDCPPANTLMSSWHTYALVAQRGVTVTLDGQGADEQLAGYLRYLRNLLIHSGTADALRSARALARNTQGGSRAAWVGLSGHALHRLFGHAGLAALSRGIERARDFPLTLPQMLTRDFATDLQTLLHYADQSSMAWSLESRMPFMDWRLVNFLARVPTAYLVHDGWTKWLARHAVRDELPAAVVWRRDKVGWAIPEPAWFGPHGPLHDWLTRCVNSSAFATAAAREAGLNLQQSPLAVRIRLLNLAVWHSVFFAEPGRPGRQLGSQPAREMASVPAQSCA